MTVCPNTKLKNNVWSERQEVKQSLYALKYIGLVILYINDTNNNTNNRF